MKITICLLSVVYLVLTQNVFSQDKPVKWKQHSDRDTAWVSTDKKTPSFAEYQVYPTPSRGKGTSGSFMIYLPEEYHNTTKRYPAIYFLHGGNGTQKDAEWLMRKMDTAIKAGKMPPVIIIGVQALPIGWYCNANSGAKGVTSGPVEDVFIKDLIPYIDEHYRTIDDRSGRGLEGWSMGGFGAIRLAFKYPEMFGFTSSLAGALIDFQDEHNPQYMANTFGPVTGPGSEKSIEYFNAVHPRFYAKKNAEMIKNNVKVRLIVGDQDWLYNNNGKLITKAFSDYLDSLGIKHDYTVLKNAGHMFPLEFADGTREYPIQFWVDAFKTILTASANEKPISPFNGSMLDSSQTNQRSNLKKSTPVMKIINLFTALDVPQFGHSEIKVDSLKIDPSPVPGKLPGEGLAQHPMLYFGECYNKIFLVNEGKIIWTYSTGPGCEYDDVWLMSNGNILFSRMQFIAIVTPKKDVIWRYDAPTGTEIHGCQPIGFDKVLFVQNGLPPKLFVMNIKTRVIEVEHKLPVDTLTDQKYVHAQFRRVRYTARGTYLVPFLELGRVVEYDKEFKEIWSYNIKTPWAAIRLKNGNTLMTDEADILTREVNPKKETVWELKQSDLPEKYRFINTQCCVRLDNGNTIICSRGGNGKGPQLVEVTKDKEVVWVLWDWKNLGPASGIQILDDPGFPEEPGDTEH